MKTIDVTIDPNGEVKVEANGFSGNECLKATENLEKALLGKKTKSIKKPEYYEQKKTNQNYLGNGA